jgi:hypothetical protein
LAFLSTLEGKFSHKKANQKAKGPKPLAVQFAQNGGFGSNNGISGIVVVPMKAYPISVEINSPPHNVTLRTGMKFMSSPQTDTIKRIESFRRIIRDQTEETHRKLFRNQESLKNIISPKVTEHKFTMNNTPGWSSFRSQSPSILKTNRFDIADPRSLSLIREEESKLKRKKA